MLADGFCAMHGNDPLGLIRSQLNENLQGTTLHVIFYAINLAEDTFTDQISRDALTEIIFQGAKQYDTFIKVTSTNQQ